MKSSHRWKRQKETVADLAGLFLNLAVTGFITANYLWVDSYMKYIMSSEYQSGDGLVHFWTPLFLVSHTLTTTASWLFYKTNKEYFSEFIEKHRKQKITSDQPSANKRYKHLQN